MMDSCEGSDMLCGAVQYSTVCATYINREP
jgi:hypothetical protein